MQSVSSAWSFALPLGRDPPVHPEPDFWWSTGQNLLHRFVTRFGFDPSRSCSIYVTHFHFLADPPCSCECHTPSSALAATLLGAARLCLIPDCSPSPLPVPPDPLPCGSPSTAWVRLLHGTRARMSPLLLADLGGDRQLQGK